jgi:hypothetical protein
LLYALPFLVVSFLTIYLALMFLTGLLPRD